MHKTIHNGREDRSGAQELHSGGAAKAEIHRYGAFAQRCKLSIAHYSPSALYVLLNELILSLFSGLLGYLHAGETTQQTRREDVDVSQQLRQSLH